MLLVLAAGCADTVAPNSPPAFRSAATATVQENTVSTTYLADAVDPDPGDEVALSLVAALDAAHLHLDETGALSFVEAPDYERPTDEDGDNLYEVEVAATDGRARVTQRVTVEVLDDPGRLEVQIDFPPTRSEVGMDATDVVVTGRLRFVEGELSDPGQLEGALVRVNAESATVDSDFAWRGRASIDEPGELIAVEAELPSGMADRASLRLTRQPEIDGVGPIAVSDDGVFVLLVDSDLNALLQVDTLTGDRWIIADERHGGGPPFVRLADVAFGSSSDQAFVVDAGLPGVFAIDTASGDRTLLADGESSPHLTQPIALDVDEDEQRLLVYDLRDEPILVGVDLDAGQTTVLVEGERLPVARTGGMALVRDPVSLYVGDAVSRLRHGAAVDLHSREVTPLAMPFHCGTWAVSRHVEAGDAVFACNSPGWIARGDGVLLPHSGWVLPFVEIAGMDVGEPGTLYIADTGRGAGGVRVGPPRVFAARTGAEPRVVVDNAVGAGGPFLEPTGVAVWPDRDGVLATDAGLVGVWAVDRALRTMVSGRDGRSGAAIGRGVRFVRPVDLAPHVHPGRAVIADGGYRGLVGVHLDTGNRSMISGPDVGQGPLLGVVTAVDVLPEGRALATNAAGELLEVRLDVGDRQLVSGGGRGAGPSLGRPRHVVADPAGAQAWVLAGPDLVEVDVATGDRVAVVSGGRLGEPVGAAREGERHLLVADAEGSAVLRVDVGTGDVAVVSGRGRGVGPPLEGIVDLDVDPASGVAWVLGARSLYAVDPVSGQRVIASRGP